MRQATPTLTIPDGAFTFSHLPAGGSACVGGTGGPSDIEKVTVNYTLDVLHAAHAAVLPDRADDAAGRVDDEERAEVRMSTPHTRQTLRDTSGQSLIEFAIVLPLFLTSCSASSRSATRCSISTSTTRITREGSNLISRDTTLPDAATAMRTMTTPAGRLRQRQLEADLLGAEGGATTGTANYNRSSCISATSTAAIPASASCSTQGAGSFGRRPTYEAANSDTNTGPAAHQPARPTSSACAAACIYVTEIYTRIADHAARSVRRHACPRRFIRLPISSDAADCRSSRVCQRAATTRTKADLWHEQTTIRYRERTGFALVYMAGI